MEGKKYCLRVTIKAKQLLNCPLEGKKINVGLLWGKRAFWGGQKNESDTVQCSDRKVLWDADQNTFEYECKVYLEKSMPTDAESRDRLSKRQPSSARLSISVSISVSPIYLSLIDSILCRSARSLIVLMASIRNMAILAVGRFRQ